jgi:hypothetical protein
VHTAGAALLLLLANLFKLPAQLFVAHFFGVVLLAKLAS